jgi:hypothetical protein
MAAAAATPTSIPVQLSSPLPLPLLPAPARLQSARHPNARMEMATTDGQKRACATGPSGSVGLLGGRLNLLLAV